MPVQTETPNDRKKHKWTPLFSKQIIGLVSTSQISALKIICLWIYGVRTTERDPFPSDVYLLWAAPEFWRSVRKPVVRKEFIRHLLQEQAKPTVARDIYLRPFC